MSKTEVSTLLSSDGKHSLHVRFWLPEDGKIKATVQIAHGVAEYIERYGRFADFLCQSGYAVFGNDHLGHGQSIGDISDKGYFADSNGWDYVVEDMHKLHLEIMKDYSELPCILFGHSMGSFLARTYIIRYPEDFSAVILSGTGNQNRAVIWAGRAIAESTVKKHGPHYISTKLNDMSMGSYNKGFDAKEGETAWLSRDKDNVAKYDADPLCGFIPTCSLLRDMLDGLYFITDIKNTEKMRKDMPVLFASGGDDPVGEKGKGVQKAYNLFINSGMKDVFLKIYPGARHEILNETNYEEVYQDILSWIETKCF
jgi:alpha-beta hydrolase superfamily lysophospholipase